ncbi:MAG TPA: hypothetical protein VNO75_07540 [Gemmatimonadaceae bacterium]|nr:hypothetical protein [Gemmatimonadaceae bacterium]
MRLLPSLSRLGATALTLVLGSACSSGLGGVLGGVLGGGGQTGQVSGTVQGVNTNRREITIQQSNGQTIPVTYDNQTRVVYQNQNYSVSSLEYGDRVTANLQQTQNGAYYTDYVQVDQSVSTSTSSGAGVGSVQTIQGTVRQIDTRNGLFTLDAGSYGVLTVSLPFNPRSSDVNRFNGLRSGDFVRFSGVFLNNSRVELRNFN